jgi:hypothetical protein
VQIGQRVAVIEPGHLGHEALDQLQDAVGAVDKAAQQLPRIDARLGAALIEPALDARGVLGGRQPDEGQVVAALEMRAGFLEGVLPLEIHQRRRRIGKGRVRIGLGGDPLRLDEDRPAGAETAQRVVEPGGDAHQLGRRGAIEVRDRESAPCAGTSRPC